MINILVVDDHAVVRKGLISLLEDSPNLNILGDVGSGEEALAFCEKTQPDVVLLDLNMPVINGIATALALTKLYPKIKKLVFTMHNDIDYILNSINSGVDGYLLKDTDTSEIIHALNSVYNGEKYFPPAVSATMVLALTTKSNHSSKLTDVLSKKEKQILKLISQGNSSSKIATDLKLSTRTVSNHRANMLRKTKLSNTVELIRIAMEEGIF